MCQSPVSPLCLLKELWPLEYHASFSHSHQIEVGREKDQEDKERKLKSHQIPKSMVCCTYPITPRGSWKYT